MPPHLLLCRPFPFWRPIPSLILCVFDRVSLEYCLRVTEEWRRS
jgi:hypothetical protein